MSTPYAVMRYNRLVSRLTSVSQVSFRLRRRDCLGAQAAEAGRFLPPLKLVGFRA